ncbi:response regulator [Marinitoga sp. 1138]|uniref:response regulator n=1 Tax=Marinitoga sp. 1138 TaxID=1643334 RepID=UPI001C316399|nr:response regulator [Marinitoga sp. 1138]NUU96904.1 chemotaxis protein CheY [Marinitoga sp. 1138]
MGKILIVDDSKMTRNYHAYILREANYEVLEAIDGAEALEILYMFGDNIDCVLTDLNMPNLDGYELIKKIREDEKLKDIPVIIVTTMDDAKDKTKGLALGANFYIVKPADPKLLKESIKLVLGDDSNEVS